VLGNIVGEIDGRMEGPLGEKVLGIVGNDDVG
jgi:hypothetical protein